ncbi:MAG: type II toxin-antitoxin system mRNA interferase toxin, RelE/StbE family [Phycisphaeraceae bacterium]|nr:type II toxin-antitoxin system mRNA interferase toxin, RelE/StbE family [Phycisphaeraceae bacterium]
MITVNTTQKTQRDLAKLDKMVRIAAYQAMQQLEDFPQVTEIEPLKGQGLGWWRKKFKKDWRLIFFVDEVTEVITVIQIIHRKNEYKDFN